MFLDLDILQYQSSLVLRKNTETTWVFDPIRKKDIVLTPEELLRQLLLQYLLQEKKYPANKIRVEIGIELNGLTKRCDIVAYDRDFQPWLLVECKSPKVALRAETFEQAARYNMRLRAPYLAISNGLSTCCCSIDLENEQFEYLTDFPTWP
jgi:hypothetical protein